MKSLLLLLSFNMLTLTAFAQVDIADLERVEGLWTKKGENQPYTGDFKETFEDGSIKGTGTFVNGQLEGLRIQYFPNGKVSTKKEYKGAYPHGKAYEYYEDGTLRQEGTFNNNQEIGTWTVYYPNGDKRVVMTFESGVQHGPYFEYNEEGVLTRQFYFKNGKAEYSDEFTALIKQASQMSGRFIPQEAIELYDKAIELNPTVAYVYFARGTAYSNALDFSKAIEDYNRALEINPNYTEVYVNRASAKINQFTTKGNLDPSPVQTQSACDDLYKAVELGDKSIATEDMIYLYCNKK